MTSSALGGVGERSEAKRILGEYLAGFESRKAAIANPPFDVADRAKLCANCHGKDGNSRHQDIPSLAGQNPAYFIEQLLIYKQAKRYPELMHGLAEKLSEVDMAAIALHFSELPRVLTVTPDQQLGTKAEALYQSYCANCHGADGRGENESYANLRGQRPDYLAVSMRRFRERSDKRSSHEMEAAVKGLSDQEIEQLAHYLASLLTGE